MAAEGKGLGEEDEEVAVEEVEEEVEGGELEGVARVIWHREHGQKLRKGAPFDVCITFTDATGWE
jgi:hypothetical protein